MSCLHDCGCSRTPKETDSSEAQVAHDESSYQPLSEASFISEVIPLLPKDPTMITYEADSTHYALMSIIGKGLRNSAIISIAHHIPTGKRVAVRRINLDLCAEELSYIQKEFLVIRQLRHENLLPYYSAFVVGNEVWAIMPLITYGSARAIMDCHYSNGLPELAIALIVKDVLSALDYVHKRGFIHRSIKASHILVSSLGKAVLSGLRYSCNMIHNGRWKSAIHSYPRDCVTNLNWLSPELLEQNLLGYNAKSDVYSLGITACELANGIVPFAGLSPTQMLLEKLHGYPPRPLDAHTLLQNDNGMIQFPNNGQHTKPPGRIFSNSSKQSVENSYNSRRFTSSLHTFTELCLQRDQSKRPSSAHLLSHSFIKQCKKMNVSLQDIFSAVTPTTELSLPFKDESNSSVQKMHIEDLALDEPWEF